MSKKSRHSNRFPVDSESQKLLRREALKGLGALAVSGTAFAAVGCSSDPASEPMAATGAGSSAPAATAGSAASGAAGAKSVATGAAGSRVTQPTAAGRASTSASGGTVSSSQGGVGGQATAAGGGGSTTAGSSGVAGAAGSSTAGSAAAGSGAPIGGAMDLDALACIVSPAMTPGPFFVEEKLDRSNLVMGETDPLITMAVPLHLTLGVFKVDGMACSPMSGVQVDIWHANANGLYSDVSPGAVQSTDTKGKKYLRGFQTTSATGVVTFETIYPGWYPSRTIHIHFKLRMPGSGNTMYDFTSQMFFDEAVSKTVLATAPYTSTKGTRSVFNEDDDVYNGTKVNGMAPGAFTLVKLTDMKPGYSGVLKIGVKM